MIRRLTPPVVLLGGSTGPLSLARELSARGVEVHISMRRGQPELATRHAYAKHAFATRDDAAALWSRLLLGSDAVLDRSVVFPCDDDAVEFLANNYSELGTRHLIDRTSREHLTTFLSKEKTAGLSAIAGVRVPQTWPVDGSISSAEMFADAPQTILLKPIHSHRFQRVFGRGGRKHFRVHTPAEFEEAATRLQDADVGAIATELVPGPDSCSTTYYVYRRRGEQPLFEFTKQVLRRFPRNEGPGSLHVVQWDEEIAAASRRLLDAIDYEGYANIEFKRDERDGLPTLIELNPRFTASQELLVRAGIPVGWLVYQSLLGAAPDPIETHQQGLLLWDPARDLRAYAEHRRREQLGFFEWMRSLRGKRVLPLFRWSDPAPSARRMLKLGTRALRGPS